MIRIGSNRQAVSNILGYTFSFAICSLIMMSAVLTTTSIIDTNSHKAAALEAQALANQVADALIDAILVRQSMPDIKNYEEILSIPNTLAGSDYYIEIADTEVYVNTTDGAVSRRSPYYSTADLDFAIYEKIHGDADGLKISYKSPTYIYKLDFGTDVSPVESGYYKVSEDSLKDERTLPWWDDDYRYRIPISIDNTDLSSSDLADVPIKIVLTREDVDFNKIKTTGMGSYVLRSNCVFYDPDLDENERVRPSIIDYFDSERIVFLVSIKIDSGESKDIYLYYGGETQSQNVDGVTVFYDSFNGQYEAWDKTYDDPDNGNDIANSVAVDGDNVYVVGYGTNLLSSVPPSKKD